MHKTRLKCGMILGRKCRKVNDEKKSWKLNANSCNIDTMKTKQCIEAFIPNNKELHSLIIALHRQRTPQTGSTQLELLSPVYTIQPVVQRV